MQMQQESKQYQRKYSLTSQPTKRIIIKRLNSISNKPNPNKQYSSVSPPHTAIHQHRKLSYWTYNINTIQPPSIKSYSYCAMMSDTHEILLSKNINTGLQVASLTKIMTAYTALVLSHQYGIKIRQHTITIHNEAFGFEGTSACLRIGDQLRIMDLLYGLLLPSGNDAAIAIAQYFGKFLSFKMARDRQGYKKVSAVQRFKQFQQYYDQEYKYDSIRLFVFEMNKNSKKIGLTKTLFTNPTGLNDPQSYSTARDIALLTSHSLKNHILRTIFKKKTYVCTARNQKLGIERQIQWKNTNKHLYQFKECIGVKTGITPNAGACLSSAYNILGRQIVIIVLKSNSVQERFNDAQIMYRWIRKRIRVCA